MLLKDMLLFIRYVYHAGISFHEKIFRKNFLGVFRKILADERDLEFLRGLIFVIFLKMVIFVNKKISN